MGFFSSSEEKTEESVEELNNEIEEVEKETLEKKGDRRLQDLKQSKREKLEKKKGELKKEKLRQTKAGKLIDKLGNGLGDLAEATDSQKAAELAETAEKVDGDGKNDSSAALDIGLEETSQDKARDIEVKGDLQVEGDIVENSSQKEKDDSIDFFDDEQEGLF